MSGNRKRYMIRIAIVAVLSAPVGLLAPVANAAQLVAPQKVSYEDAVPGIAPPDAPLISAPAEMALTNQLALGCTPETYGDNPHLSSTPGVISAHGWWKQGDCTNNKATVENCLYEYYTDGTWRRKACNTASGIFPGGGSANRSAANRPCDTTETISWRNRVDVDVDDEIDSSGTIDRQADVNCAITGDDQ